MGNLVEAIETERDQLAREVERLTLHGDVAQKHIDKLTERLGQNSPDHGLLERLRKALFLYGGHVPPCDGQPCECGFKAEWDAAQLPPIVGDLWKQGANLPPIVSEQQQSETNAPVTHSPEPSAYLKLWDQHGPCMRVDLGADCEPWLQAQRPIITPLYARLPSAVKAIEPVILNSCDHRRGADDTGEFCSTCGERVPPKATANCFQYSESACPAHCQGGRKCVLERSPMKAIEPLPHLDTCALKYGGVKCTCGAQS